MTRSSAACRRRSAPKRFKRAVKKLKLEDADALMIKIARKRSPTTK